MGVSVEVLNDSTRTVTPKFYLCEKQTVVAQSKRMVHTNDMFFGAGDSVPAQTSRSMTKVISIPPQLPPTFFNCCMMKLEYRLKVPGSVMYNVVQCTTAPHSGCMTTRALQSRREGGGVKGGDSSWLVHSLMRVHEGKRFILQPNLFHPLKKICVSAFCKHYGAVAKRQSDLTYMYFDLNDPFFVYRHLIYSQITKLCCLLIYLSINLFVCSGRPRCPSVNGASNQAASRHPAGLAKTTSTKTKEIHLV